MTPQERATAVYQAILQWGPQMGYINVLPSLIYAQAYHESDGFTSNLAVTYANVFGMTFPTVRDTTATGWFQSAPGAPKFATYNSYSDAVRDYFLRQRAFHIADTDDPAQYMFDTVQSGYAEDPDYLAKWGHIFQTVDPPGGGLDGSGGPGVDTDNDGGAWGDAGDDNEHPGDNVEHEEAGAGGQSVLWLLLLLLAMSQR